MTNSYFATPESSVLATIGSILGYIGAEITTDSSFECLLWPQRFLSGYSPASHGLALALLSPMGGPLHKAAIKALDDFFTHGLFKGPRLGHMLGTSFFRPVNWTYTMHGGDGDRNPPTSEPVRNCLWVRALSCVATPVPGHASGIATSASVEKGLPLRTQTVVSHLTLSRPSPEDLASSNIPFVSEGVDTPGLHTFLAIITAEITGVLTAAGILALYRSFWGILWLIPLLLRLASAVLALDREQLLQASSAALSDPPCDFEIHSPESEGSFMLLTGPPTLVLQFFRHYGHPIRNRPREVCQLVTVAALGCFFPASLVCFIVWMSAPIQNVWLCYQLYVFLAMCVGRYSPAGTSTTTEARIGELLGRETDLVGTGNDGVTAAALSNERAILFGQTRNGAGTIKASASITYHGRYGEGREYMQRLLRRREPERRPVTNGPR